MRNRLYWGLGAVMCLVVGVGFIVVNPGHQQAAETVQIELTSLNWYDSPEEAIGYGLKLLCPDTETEETCSRTKAETAHLHAVLGLAYQRLGDYKTAWVHLKKGQTLTEQCLVCCPEPGEETLQSEVTENVDYAAHITALMSGNPLIQTKQRIPAADKAARFEELSAFLDWAGAIMRDTPITTNNFLAKELESHLLGKETTFHPERITRAFELMEQHKQSKGMRLLQQSDPPLAREVLRLFNKKKSSVITTQKEN